MPGEKMRSASSGLTPGPCPEPFDDRLGAVPGHAQPRLATRVAAGVLEHRLQYADGDVTVDADVERRLGLWTDVQVHLVLRGQVSARLHA